MDVEPPPHGMSPSSAMEFGYGIFSARYGNIYTARELRQLFEEACGRFSPADVIWKKNDRYYDALRPSIEPFGLASRQAVVDMRAYHLRKVLSVLRTADIFIFTLGLTEAWVHGPSGTVYPTAPGTIAGAYDAAVHKFHNFDFEEVYGDLVSFFDLAREHNPEMRFLLTVSPVPLTATASGEHVLHATMYSKSVLRAVAGRLHQQYPYVDYFPSYEIITSALSRACFFEDNLRSVRAAGVAAVMDTFFGEHAAATPDPDAAPGTENHECMAASEKEAKADEDVVCEEALLEAFSPR